MLVHHRSKTQADRGWQESQKGEAGCKSPWPLEWPFHSIQLCDRLWRWLQLQLQLRLRPRLGRTVCVCVCALWLNLTETGKYFEGTGNRKQAIIQMNFKSNHYKTFTKYAQHAAQNRRNLSGHTHTHTQPASLEEQQEQHNCSRVGGRWEAGAGTGRWQVAALAATALGVINFYYYDTD